MKKSKRKKMMMKICQENSNRALHLKHFLNNQSKINLLRLRSKLFKNQVLSKSTNHFTNHHFLKLLWGEQVSSIRLNFNILLKLEEFKIISPIEKNLYQEEKIEMWFIHYQSITIYSKSEEKILKQLHNNICQFKPRNITCTEIQEFLVVTKKCQIEDCTETTFTKNTNNEPRRYKNTKNRKELSCSES